MQEQQQQDLGKVNARLVNCSIGRYVANSVKSTLGPKGMDKMIAKEDGTTIISNDGATILKEMSIEHPIGKMLVNLATNQDSEVGDGTTSAVIITGALLEETEKLLSDGIHISNIINGYKLANTKAKDLYKEIAFDIGIKDKDNLISIIDTSMTGKASEGTSVLSNIVLDSINNIYNTNINRELIDVKLRPGKSIEDSYLYNGLIITKGITSVNMPKQINNAKILLLNTDLDLSKEEKEYKFHNPLDYETYLNAENSYLKQMADKIIETGANVVMCQKGINEIVEFYLGKAGIMAIKRVTKGKIDLLAKLTNGLVYSTLQELDGKYLGKAKKVYEETIDNEENIFIEGFNNNFSTIILRGGTEQYLNEIERAINDAIGAVVSTLEINRFVVGAGSCETYVASKLRDYAKEVKGKEQLAIQSFANALEVIPKTLAESSGQDVLDVITALRNNVITNAYYGVDVKNKCIADMGEKKVFEPLKLKLSALDGANEVVNMILRIDDIIKGR